jgi:hypothetical protein
MVLPPLVAAPDEALDAPIDQDTRDQADTDRKCDGLERLTSDSVRQFRGRVGQLLHAPFKAPRGAACRIGEDSQCNEVVTPASL